MCGLAFLHGHRSEKVIGDMLSKISHRGPDDYGIVNFNGYSLGHVRLSIQDTSEHGRQPMQSRSKSHYIVFNGEIYNFKELRENLKNKDHLVSSSDSEVLLEHLVQYGVEPTLNVLNGMFSFVLVDTVLQKAFVARDRNGEKPLYYGKINDHICIASELHSFKAIGVSEQDIDPEALQLFFRLGYVPAPYSIIQGVSKLEPGKFFEIDLVKGEFSNSKSFIETDSFSKSVGQIDSFESATDRLDELLNEVVSDQLISDRPLGALLSGGVDSSLVTAVAQSQSATALETFTIGFKEKEFDESPYARKVADILGSKVNTLIISESDVLENQASVLQRFDEPFSNASQIASFLVSKFAREKVTVALSGDGGDEFFIGYNRYTYGQRVASLSQRLPNFLKNGLDSLVSSADSNRLDRILKSARIGSGSTNIGIKAKKALRGVLRSDGNDLYEYLISNWFQSEKLVVDSQDKLSDLLTLRFQNFAELAAKWDRQYYLNGDCLYKSDRTSMANGLELRAPLIDPRITNFSSAIPQQFKFKGNESKLILKNLLRRYIPAELIDRPKMGFTVPLERWMQNELRGEVEQAIFEYEGSEINIEPVQEALREFFSGKTELANSLWCVFSYIQWKKGFFDEGSFNVDRYDLESKILYVA